jgi:hypothetical protein
MGEEQTADGRWGREEGRLTAGDSNAVGRVLDILLYKV